MHLLTFACFWTSMIAPRTNLCVVHQWPIQSVCCTSISNITFPCRAHLAAVRHRNLFHGAFGLEPAAALVHPCIVKQVSTSCESGTMLSQPCLKEGLPQVSAL